MSAWEGWRYGFEVLLVKDTDQRRMQVVGRFKRSGTDKYAIRQSNVDKTVISTNMPGIIAGNQES